MAKYFGPLLLKYIFKKVQRTMEDKFNAPPQDARQNTSKSSKTFKSKTKDNKVGEYVDYEEID